MPPYAPYPPQGYPTPWAQPYAPGPYAPQPYGPPPQMVPPYPAEYPAQPRAARRPRKKMRRSSIVVLIIILLLLAGGGVTAYLLLRGEGKASFNFGNGSVVGAKIEFHGLTLSQNGNNLTLTGTYDNKSKSKGSVYVTIQAISKTSEQSMTFTVPVTSGSGKSFAQKKTTSMKLESAALGSLFFQGTGSSRSSGSSGVNQSSGSTSGGTYPWESQSGTIAPTPQQSSATNSF